MNNESYTAREMNKRQLCISTCKRLTNTLSKNSTEAEDATDMPRHIKTKTWQRRPSFLRHPFVGIETIKKSMEQDTPEPPREGTRGLAEYLLLVFWLEAGQWAPRRLPGYSVITSPTSWSLPTLPTPSVFLPTPHFLSPLTPS